MGQHHFTEYGEVLCIKLPNGIKYKVVNEPLHSCNKTYKKI